MKTFIPHFRRASILVLLLCPLALSSCGLAKSAVQLPVRAAKSVGRTVGM